MKAKTGSISMLDDTLFLDRFFHSQLGRIFITAVQTFLVSTVLLLVIIFRQLIPLQVLIYAVVVMVGLTAGFSARRFLKDSTVLLQILAALLALILSLGAQYSLTNGFIGILPFPGTPRYPDWESLIQLGAAGFGALLVVLSFRKRVSKDPSTESPVQIPTATTPAQENNGGWLPKLRFPIKVKSRPATTQMAAVDDHTVKPTKLSLTGASPRNKEKPVRKKRKSSLEIHFIGEEEHTCPYCLDIVEKKDPRGVKICPDCKTWHHADCWGITGACQIPHAHSK